MSSSSLAFFYFDLGNVLVLFDHEQACRQIADVAQTTPQRVKEVLFDGRQLQWRYERGDLTTNEFYKIFCQRTGTQPPLDKLLHAASAMFRLNVAVLPVVAQLKSAGYATGVLSNTCDAHWQYISGGRYKVIDQLFDVHALSFQLRAMKPEPAIYHLAAQMAGVLPQQIFFVDDRPENVEAACRFGFDAVLFCGARELSEQLRRRGIQMNY